MKSFISLVSLVSMVVLAESSIIYEPKCGRGEGVSFTETRAWHTTSDVIPMAVFGIFQKRYQRGLDILNNGFEKVTASVDNTVDSDTFQLNDEGKTMTFEVENARITTDFDTSKTTTAASFGVIIALKNNEASFTICNCVSEPENEFCRDELKQAVITRLEKTVRLVQAKLGEPRCEKGNGGVSFSESRPWHKASDEIPAFVFGLFQERYQRGLDILNTGFVGVSATTDSDVDSTTFVLDEDNTEMTFEISNADITTELGATNEATDVSFKAIVSLSDDEATFTICSCSSNPGNEFCNNELKEAVITRLETTTSLIQKRFP